MGSCASPVAGAVVDHVPEAFEFAQGAADGVGGFGGGPDERVDAGAVPAWDLVKHAPFEVVERGADGAGHAGRLRLSGPGGIGRRARKRGVTMRDIVLALAVLVVILYFTTER